MRSSYEKLLEVARGLAMEHKTSDPLTEHVFFDPTSEAASEVRLIEVTADLPDTNEVMPFRYAANPERGHDFAITLVLLSPSDWKQLPKKRRILETWSAPEEFVDLLQAGAA